MIKQTIRLFQAFLPVQMFCMYNILLRYWKTDLPVCLDTCFCNILGSSDIYLVIILIIPSNRVPGYRSQENVQSFVIGIQRYHGTTNYQFIISRHLSHFELDHVRGKFSRATGTLPRFIHNIYCTPLKCLTYARTIIYLKLRQETN